VYRLKRPSGPNVVSSLLAQRTTAGTEGFEMKHPTDVGGVAVFRAMRLGALAVFFWLVASAAAQEHVLINFDDPTLAAGVHAGNIFLEDGLRITSCLAPDSIKTGKTITLTGLQPWIELWRYGWAVSAPNYVVALNAGTTDMLLSFTVPVTNVAIKLDFYPNEIKDKGRIAIVEPTTGNSFEVLKIVEFTDENGVPPATSVAIDLDGTAFSYVLFQTLTELEGFDDLEFDTTGPIPPPTGEGPPGPPPPGSGGWEGGGGGSGGSGIDPPATNDNSSGGSGQPTTDNENKTPENPGTGGSTSGSDPPAAGNTNSSASGSDTPAAEQGSSSGGGACGAPVAIIMLSGMFLLRLLAGRKE
jgi:hypothetical protein